MSDIRPTAADTSWFTHDRFGLFIHWGLYSMGARHEWLQHLEKMSPEEYRKYFELFDPDLYDPAVWADAAAAAGMKYFVITTKHHDGFCLWDSKLTDFKAPNTPAGRDLLRPMVDAFRARDMHVGLYHSLIDWHHPDFTVDRHIGPFHDKSPEERAKMNEGRDQQKYIDYLHGQVRELLSEFGKIDILWLDFSYNDRGEEGKGWRDWGSPELVKLVRELQPHLILNDRLDLTDQADAWDVKTPEQIQPRSWVTLNGQRVVWETCQTFSGSWGYHRDEQTWKSTGQLIRMLINSVSCGGNLLLNVGPTGRGEFDERALDRLNGIGEWMKRHSRSIYGCTQAPEEFPTPQDCRLTWNPDTNRLYVHVYAWPFKHLYLDGQAFGNRVRYAQLLNDGSEVRIHRPDSGVLDQATPMDKPKDVTILELPVEKPNVTVPVIELILK